MRLEPKIGDTLRTATPMNCDSLLYSAGEYLRVKLTNAEQLPVAFEFIKSGGWIIEADLQSRCPHANTANVGDGGDDVECLDCGKVVVK